MNEVRNVIFFKKYQCIDDKMGDILQNKDLCHTCMSKKGGRKNSRCIEKNIYLINL